MKKILNFILILLTLSRFTYGQVNSSNKNIPTDLLVEDYDYLLKALQETPPLFDTLVDRDEFMEQSNRLRALLNQSLSTKEFKKILLQTVALLHTKSSLLIGGTGFASHLKNGGLAFPFCIKYLSGNVYIAENFSTNDSLVRGTEIIAINGVTISTIVEELTPYLRVRKNGSISQQLCFHWAELLWLHYGFNKEFTLTYLSPFASKIETSTVQGINRKPKATKSKENNFRLRIDAEQKIAIISLNRFYKGDREFQAFLDSSFAEIKMNRIENLIIDVRENHGLSVRFTPALMDYLTDKAYLPNFVTIVKSSTIAQKCFKTNPLYIRVEKAIRKDSLNYLNPVLDQILENQPGAETKISTLPSLPDVNKTNRFHGNLYLLTSHETYAEGTSFAALIKDSQRGYIVGEETCDKACSYGLSVLAELPNTKIKVQIPAIYTIRTSGHDDGRGVIPDFVVHPSIQDDIKGNDKVMKYTYWLIEQSGK